jgi:predicted lipoprotein with Yx(FWY)xxD motif
MRTPPRVPVFAMVLLLTAACGADPAEQGGGVGGERGGDQPADEEGSPEGAADVSAGEAHVAVSSSSEFGDILVDAEGMTLYLFTQDSDGRSVCEDDCAAAWPPLLVDGAPVAGEGVEASLLDTIERDDGSTQVSYAGWPLYTWAQDQQPGDVTGQGVQEVWFVVSPDGEPIRDGEDPAPVGDGY